MTQTYDFDEMNRTVIREFRDTGGKAGGVFEGMPIVLVHHIGVKSGIERIAPLVPLLEDGRIFVFASKGGSDENPHWYGNLLAHPQITVDWAPKRSPQPRGSSPALNAMTSTRDKAPSSHSSPNTSATQSD